MADEGMFTKLMDASKQESQPKPEKPKEDWFVTALNKGVTEAAKKEGVRRGTSQPAPASEPDASLPKDLESFKAGSHNRSYRFTAAEVRWLRRFCLKASEAMDREISHNTMIRILFRLAENEWNDNPESNRLIDLISRIKE